MEYPDLKILSNILKMAIERGASDIHFAAGSRLMLRVNGTLTPASDDWIEAGEIEELVAAVLGETQRAELKKTGQVLETYSAAGLCRVRVCVFRQRSSYAMTMRLLSEEIPKTKDLLLPEQLSAWAAQKSGLILIAGTAGSGRSTTLASVLSHVASQQGRVIVTAEKPVEYIYPPDFSVIYQREIGRDGLSGGDIVRMAMKQDADIVAAEPESAAAVAQSLLAAQTGQLVFLTVAAGSAAGAIEELTAYFPAEHQARVRKQIAGALLGITLQKLLPKADGAGRVAAFAVVQGTPAVQNLIREDKMEQLSAAMHTDGSAGMCTMDDAIYELYMKSRISPQTAIDYADDSAAMRAKV